MFQNIQDKNFLIFLINLKCPIFALNNFDMPIQIEVQDTHAQLLIDFYVQRLKTLRDEILERERETKDINNTIQRLKKKNSLSTSQELPEITALDKTAYSDKWPWIKKVSFALSGTKNALTTKEIVDVLTEYEPAFLFDRKRAIASISSILSSRWGADKEFIRIQSDSGDFAYTINKPEKESEIENNIVSSTQMKISSE